MSGTHTTHGVPALAFSAKAGRTHEQPISFLINEAIKNPRLINLAAGLVDPLTLPVKETAAITHKLMADVDRGRAVLQYGTTVGLGDLRKLLLTHIEELEGVSAAAMGLSADDMILTTGSQQALYLIGDVLVNPGDIVIAANPSYFVYAGVLTSLGAEVVGVPMDDDGMVVEKVAEALARLEKEGRLEKVRFVYCTSYFQNPTGLTLSAERRPRLLEIVKQFSKKHRILILEDAAYRELNYDGPVPRSIKSYDTHNQYTVISHTFSKPFAPGIKLGYSIGPTELMHAITEQKGNHDFGSSNLCQHIALESLVSGAYAKHVKTLQAAYKLKKDRILKDLQRHLGDVPGVHWTHPGGGLYVWLTLPKSMNTARRGRLFKACVDAGVLYVPGEYCFQPDENGHVPKHHLRLSFGQVHLDQIDPGIERLASSIRSVMETPDHSHPSPAAAV